MPDRILRAELLESEAWLSLKDNADRAAWLALFLNADTFGNMPAGAHRLMRLWNPYGIDSTEKVARVLTDLSDVDLVRVYEIGGKRYLHIPRFNQSRRFLGRLWPVPPWSSDEEKQAYAKKSQVNPRGPLVNHGEPPVGVGVGVGVDVELPTTSLPKVKNKNKDTLAAKKPPLPDWLTPEAWQTWIDHRRAIRKPMTPRAAILCIARLDRLRQGGDPTPIIDHAIEAGWQFFYPLSKEKSHDRQTRDTERQRVLNGLTGRRR